MSRASEKQRRRYGIGEWYGNLLNALTPEKRQVLAKHSLAGTGSQLPCPFRSTPESVVPCEKEGGVCTLRLYAEETTGAETSVVSGLEGSLVTVCPRRFLEGNKIFQWVGEVLLGHSNPLIAPEVPFLTTEVRGRKKNVGKIDCVLVHPARDPLHWCALEMQAVYFSGFKMHHEFQAIRNWSKPTLPFPVKQRRPDYRSSAPKRLMPQLQIKVPSLRRWGKKMAVVVDRPFFDALGKMETVQNVSNCDIAWFVVQYGDKGGRALLEADSVKLTTLERAVEGLTGGDPVNQEEFEGRVREKLKKSNPAF